jgi:DNA-binding CsgD family transcriptional regulator
MKRDCLTEQHIQQIVRLCHAGLHPRTLMTETIKHLRTLMAIDASFFATVDPATLLFTGSVADDILLRVTPQFLVNEFLQDDVNAFRALAREPHPVGYLDAATQHQMERSPRYRDILAPLALGDELRAALRVDGICWGVLCLHRERASVPYSRAEAEVLNLLTPHLATGLRQALLLGASAGPTLLDAPGLLLLADDLSLVATTPAAERWLAELAAPDWPHTHELPTAIYAVAGRLQALEQAGDARTSQMPRVRLRTRSGQWLVLHASRMSGPAVPAPIAVIVEVAQPLEIAPLIVQAYNLSKREGEIVLCVVRGLSSAEIVNELHISANTVQDYLKAIFDRVGVRSRRELTELTAGIFAQHYQPRLIADCSLDSQGQFK